MNNLNFGFDVSSMKLWNGRRSFFAKIYCGGTLWVQRWPAKNNQNRMEWTCGWRKALAEKDL